MMWMCGAKVEMNHVLPTTFTSLPSTISITLHKTLHQIGWYSLVIISLCSTVGVDFDVDVEKQLQL